MPSEPTWRAVAVAMILSSSLVFALGHLFLWASAR